MYIDVKGLQTVKATLNKMGYAQPEIDETKWNDLSIGFLDHLKSKGTKSPTMLAVFIADIMIATFPRLCGNMERGEWYLPNKNNGFIYWVLNNDELLIFIATFIKAYSPGLYSAQQAKFVLQTLQQDIRVMVSDNIVNPRGYFAFKNGILNIQTNTLEDKVDGIFTRQFEYDYLAHNPESIVRANKFIDSFIYRDWEQEEKIKTRRLLYECLRYGCLPKHILKKVFVFYGESNTGKSTFPKIWNKLLQSRYTLVPEDADRRIGDNFFLYAVSHSQVLHMDEVNGKSRKLRDFIKAMSTVQTNVSVRCPGGESKSTDISCLLTFTTNHAFKFKESSAALFNRLMPVHFAQEQEILPNWDIEEILTDRLLVDLIIGMVHHFNPHGWTMPYETIRLREEFCVSEDDESKLFKGIIQNGSQWIRASELMEKMNRIVRAHNAMQTEKDDMVEEYTRMSFPMRMAKVCSRLGLQCKPSRSKILLTDPNDQKNIKIVKSSGWENIKWVDKQDLKQMSAWERVTSGMLDDDEEIVPNETPFTLPF